MTVLRCIQIGRQIVEMKKLEDGSYVVESYNGGHLKSREATTGYDDAMIHYLLMSKAAKKKQQEG
jgi:hypothetical protein